MKKCKCCKEEKDVYIEATFKKGKEERTLYFCKECYDKDLWVVLKNIFK